MLIGDQEISCLSVPKMSGSEGDHSLGVIEKFSHFQCFVLSGTLPSPFVVLSAIFGMATPSFYKLCSFLKFSPSILMD